MRASVCSCYVPKPSGWESPYAGALDLEVLELAGGADLVLGQLDQAALGEVGAAGIADQHRHPRGARGLEPGEHAAGEGPLVADVARQDHVDLGRRLVEQVGDGGLDDHAV